MSKFKTVPKIFFSALLLLMVIDLHAENTSINPFVIEKFDQHTVIHRNGKFTESTKYATRIGTEAGVDTESNHEFEYRPDRETLKIIDAYTLTPDGRKFRVQRDWIRVSADVTKDGRNFDSTKKITIVFPKVSVGAKLYSHTVKKVFNPPNKNRFSDYSSLSSNYVFEEFVFTLQTPKSLKLKLNVDTDSFEGGIIRETKDRLVYQFKASQPSARQRTSGQTDSSDYAPRLLFTTYSDYVDIGREYEKSSARKTRVTSSVRKLAGEVTAGIEKKSEKIRALHDWVKKNIRYVSSTVGDGGFVPRDVDYILSQRFGDCKDHVVVLRSLLRAVGIESSPALINQGTSYKLRDGPAVSKPLNHVILYIPSEDLYLDPTARLAPFGILNDQLLDKPVVLTALNRLHKTPNMSADSNRVESMSDMSLREDGSIEGKNTSTLFGTLDIDARYDFASKENDPESKTVGDLLYRFNEVGTGSVSFTPPQDTEKNFRWDSSFNLAQVANLTKRDAFSLPIGIAPAFIGLKTIYLPQPKGDLPYVCYSYSAIEELRLHLPSSIRVEQIPSDLFFEINNIKYQATYQLKDSILYAKREFRVSRPTMTCNADDFNNWLDALSNIRADFRSKIIFTPLNP